MYYVLYDVLYVSFHSSLKFYTLHSNSKVLKTVEKGQKLSVNTAPAACYTFSNAIQIGIFCISAPLQHVSEEANKAKRLQKSLAHFW